MTITKASHFLLLTKFLDKAFEAQDYEHVIYYATECKRLEAKLNTIAYYSVIISEQKPLTYTTGLRVEDYYNKTLLD